MKKINWMSIKRNLNVALFKVKKHSPEILVVTGCAGTVIGTVMACKETLRLEEVIDETKSNIEAAKALNTDDSKKEVTKAYLGGAGNIVKLYAPSVIVSGLSIGMIFSSNNIMRKRNAAAAAAYATVDSMFRKYRAAVVDKYGAEVDEEMRYGLKKETIEEVVTDSKGKSKVVKKQVITADIDDVSDYAKWFDETCIGWDKDPEYNLMFLRGVEKMCNNKLIANGYLFLNDVYEALGIERTWAGQYAGWVYDPDDPMGDNRVDFKIYENKERKRAFVNGIEPCILLDFNIDGDIMNDERLKLYLKDV